MLSEITQLGDAASDIFQDTASRLCVSSVFLTIFDKIYPASLLCYLPKLLPIFLGFVLKTWVFWWLFGVLRVRGGYMTLVLLTDDSRLRKKILGI